MMMLILLMFDDTQIQQQLGLYNINNKGEWTELSAVYSCPSGELHAFLLLLIVYTPQHAV